MDTVAEELARLGLVTVLALLCTCLLSALAVIMLGVFAVVVVVVVVYCCCCCVVVVLLLLWLLFLLFWRCSPS